VTHRYAALRLEALLTSPKAFASTHAIESKFTTEDWADRVWREDAVVLVCVAHPVTPQSNEGSGIFDGEWVGSAILRGPIPGHEYALQPDSGAPLFGSDDVETKWQMTAVFASATHRGRGLGKMLIQAGKDYAMAHTSDLRSGLVSPQPAKVRLRVLIHPDNLVVLSLYSATGFVDVGRTTGQEAYRTNGDLSSWDLKLKTLTDELKVYWKTAKVAVVMEWSGEI
jgi:GNAT superfamily N-acetyltransferase